MQNHLFQARIYLIETKSNVQPELIFSLQSSGLIQVLPIEAKRAAPAASLYVPTRKFFWRSASRYLKIGNMQEDVMNRGFHEDFW